MATWDQLGVENRAAARKLFAAGCWRSAVSRAYYAVYAAASAALVTSGVAMKVGREGPPHRQLPDLIVNHLTTLRMPVRWLLYGMVRSLYDLRLIADYRPSNAVDGADARNAGGLMVKAMSLLAGGGR